MSAADECCWVCAHAITPEQTRFGSPSTGWEHMAGECPTAWVDELGYAFCRPCAVERTIGSTRLTAINNLGTGTTCDGCGRVLYGATP